MPLPTSTYVISELETDEARRKFGRDVRVFPFTAVRHLTPGEPGDHAPYVLVVGSLAQRRNAEGLVEILEELHRRAASIPLRLVSATGLDPTVLDHVDGTMVEFAGNVDDLTSEYAGARLVLVPAKRASGMKSTIIQCWAAERACVAFSGSANTVGRSAQSAVASSDTAAGIADHLEALWTSPESRDALVEQGTAQLAGPFNPETNLEALTAHLLRLATAGRDE